MKHTSVWREALLCLCLGWIAPVLMAAEAPETITVRSSAFDHHGMVPLEYTAYGDNVSVPLTWSDLPAGTRELALIMDDPEVVTLGMMEQPFVHWVAYNIPVSAPGLPAGLPSGASLDLPDLAGMSNGLNGTRRSGYFGPRPPNNGHLHAYHFRIYALDADLDLEPGLNKSELLAAIQGHVLATGMLMGHYQYQGD